MQTGVEHDGQMPHGLNARLPRHHLLEGGIQVRVERLQPELTGQCRPPCQGLAGLSAPGECLLGQLPVTLGCRPIAKDGDRGDHLARLVLAEGQCKRALTGNQAADGLGEILVPFGIGGNFHRRGQQLETSLLKVTHVAADGEQGMECRIALPRVCNALAQLIEPGLSWASHLCHERLAVVEELDQRLRLLEGFQPRIDQPKNVALGHAVVDGLGLDKVSMQPEQVRP